jgi:HK97 family phage prohead protease
MSWEPSVEQRKQLEDHNIVTRGLVLGTVEAEGIVEAYVAVCGVPLNFLWMTEIVHSGAFKKTIRERGPEGTGKIRVLNGHNRQKVLGQCLEIAEHSRGKLPKELLAAWPEATGALYTKSQFNLSVQHAAEEFAHYRAGDKDEWSIGFRAIKERWEEQKKGPVIRHLDELKVIEYSTVLFGQNPATTTTGTRSEAQTSPLITDIVELSEQFRQKFNRPAETLAELVEFQNTISEPQDDDAAEPETLTATKNLALRIQIAEINHRLTRSVVL